jgi:hypothetical protein
MEALKQEEQEGILSTDPLQLHPEMGFYKTSCSFLTSAKLICRELVINMFSVMKVLSYWSSGFVFHSLKPLGSWDTF